MSTSLVCDRPATFPSAAALQHGARDRLVGISDGDAAERHRAVDERAAAGGRDVTAGRARVVRRVRTPCLRRTARRRRLLPVDAPPGMTSAARARHLQVEVDVGIAFGNALVVVAIRRRCRRGFVVDLLWLVGLLGLFGLVGFSATE